MAKRIEVHINQSGDPMGVEWSVFRKDSPGVSLSDPVVAVVDEANTLHTAFRKLGEPMVQDASNPFIYYLTRIYEEMPRPVVYVNGAPIPDSDITTHPFSKKIELVRTHDYTNTSVTCDYWYLAAIVEDDNRPRYGVQHFGPVPTGLNAPIGFSQVFNWNTYNMELSWVLDTTPHMYYYALRAKNKSNYLSDLSAEQAIPISVDPTTVSYVIERGTSENGPWKVAAIVSEPKWLDSNASPAGHIPLQTWGVNNHDGSATITSLNPWDHWKDNQRSSWYYRVHVKDDEDEVGPSAPTRTFYSGLNYKPVKYILRRKLDNGSPATLDGVDAIDVHTWMEKDFTTTPSTISFTDTNLPPAVYGYTTYVIDEKGMVGEPYYCTVDMR